MTVFTDNWFDLQKIAEMLDHGRNSGNATRQNQLVCVFRIGMSVSMTFFARPSHQPVADLPYGITSCWAVNQIGLAKTAQRVAIFGVSLWLQNATLAEGFDAFEI